MRRRLTVTGSSQNIDGSVKPGVAPSGDLKKHKGSKQDQVSVVSCVMSLDWRCACVVKRKRETISLPGIVNIYI